MAPGPGAPGKCPPPPICLVPGPGRPLRSCVSTLHAWDPPELPLSLPQGPCGRWQGGGGHVSYLQPSLAGRERSMFLGLPRINPGHRWLLDPTSQRPCRMAPGQEELELLPAFGRGSQEGEGHRPPSRPAQASWDCGAVAPQRVPGMKRSLGWGLQHPWSFRWGIVSSGALALGSTLGGGPGRGRGCACPPRCWRSVPLPPPAGVAPSGAPGAFLPGRQR